MLSSATYICPVRGLISLQPPDPMRLGQASQAAKAIGLERLLLPVLEESLLVPTRVKVAYLDGLIRALDQLNDAALTAWLIAPAQKMLGVDFVAPYLVKAGPPANSCQVYVDGRLRELCPYEWWKDPVLIQKRIRVFREIVAAVHGHPALAGWAILDSALTWSRPDQKAAHFLLRSYVLEIRERDEHATIYLCSEWSELLSPSVVQDVSEEVTGLYMRGLENVIPALKKPQSLASEVLMLSYLATLAQWLFRGNVCVEVGWGALHRQGSSEKLGEAWRALKGQGVAGANWLSLIDPDPAIENIPPWALKSGLDRIGLLDHHSEPKEAIATWQKASITSVRKKSVDDFIDIGQEEYLDDPHTHLSRLWEHFRESQSPR